jgi:hypothetical protein
LEPEQIRFLVRDPLLAGAQLAGSFPALDSEARAVGECVAVVSR